MKKLAFILAVAVISLQSCNASQKNNNNSNDGNTVPAETVSQNSGEDGGSVKLTKEKFLKEVWDYESSPQEWKFKGDKPALIDFYADWCGPCKIASPILEEISKEYAGKITIQSLGWKSGGLYKHLEDDISSVAYWYQSEPHNSFPTIPEFCP